MRMAVMAGVVLALTAIAFYPNYLSKIGGASALMHLHAFACTAWIVLLFGQFEQIRRGVSRYHGLIGRLSLVLVVGVIGTGIAVTTGAVLRAPEVGVGTRRMLILSSGGLLLYTVGVIGGLRNRRGDGPLNDGPLGHGLHARYMVVSVIGLMGAVLQRLLLHHLEWVQNSLTAGMIDLALLMALCAVLARRDRTTPSLQTPWRVAGGVLLLDMLILVVSG